jgi:replicative DNA helicase
VSEPYDDRIRTAEQQVLGALLVGSERVILDVFEEVKPADFYRVTDGEIVECIHRMVDHNEPVSPVTVSERLGTELRRVGGMSYLLELHGKAPIPASNAAYLAREIVRPAAMLRIVRSVGHRLAALGEADVGSVDAPQILDAARGELDAVVRDDVDESNVERDVWASMDSLEADGATPTPWRDLTLAIGGWMPGCLYIVGARPAIGKSVVGVDIGLDVARRGLTAHLANVEMSKNEIYHRLLCNVASVDHSHLVHRTLSKTDWASLGEAAKHIATLPLSVDDNPAQRVSDIRARCRTLARRGPLGIVVVDYLQLMQSGRRIERREQEVAGFSRSLKLLAKELHVPVVAISQLNRGPEQRADRQPQMSDFRESGALEQDADGVLLLHRDEDEPDIMKMLIGKSRHGPAGRLVRLSWRGQFSRVEDYNPSPPIGSYYDESA